MDARQDDTRPSGLLVVGRGQGEHLLGVEINVRAGWSDGHVCIFDQAIPPGMLTPAHSHDAETQFAYVVEGRISFWVDGAEAEVGAGDVVVRPAGSVHSLWNASTEPARMLEITTPGEPFQRFQLQLRELHAAGGDSEAMNALAESYGTHLFADRTGELCERHGVRVARGYVAVDE